MFRFALAIILISSLCGALWCVWRADAEKNKIESAAWECEFKRDVFAFARRDIPKGNTIVVDDIILEAWRSKNKRPQTAIAEASLVVGTKARLDIKNGVIIESDYLDPKLGPESLIDVSKQTAILQVKRRAVYAARAIKAGETFTSEMLEQREISSIKMPREAIARPSIAIGRSGSFDISAGEIIFNSNLNPRIVNGKETYE